MLCSRSFFVSGHGEGRFSYLGEKWKPSCGGLFVGVALCTCGEGSTRGSFANAALWQRRVSRLLGDVGCRTTGQFPHPSAP